jgi:hypothetical protein
MVAVAALLDASVAVTLLAPTTADDGTRNVGSVPLKLPFASVLTLLGVVVSAPVPNLNAETLELAANPCPLIVTVAPGLAGAPGLELAGVSVMIGLIVNVFVPVAVMARLALASADTVCTPAAWFGAVQPVPVALAIAPVLEAVIPQTLPVWFPIVTKMKSPAGHPAPLTATGVPGVPDVGEIEIVGMSTDCFAVALLALALVSVTTMVCEPLVAVLGTVNVTPLMFPLASVVIGDVGSDVPSKVAEALTLGAKP